VSYEQIALTMFGAMMLMLLTGQRVFGAIGFVAAAASLALWGDGGFEMPFNAAFVSLNWYPLVTLPMFILMGYVMSETGVASDLYRLFHVGFGRLRGGLAIGTIGLMVVISAINGLSVAGMAIGATIAMPELLRRGYDKTMVTGVIQAGSSLGILIPPSVVLVLYGMIARAPVTDLWLAGVLPGLMMAALFVAYIVIRCALQPELAPVMAEEDRAMTPAERWAMWRSALLPLGVFAAMAGPFLGGVTSLTESSAVGAAASLLAAGLKGRLNLKVLETVARQTLAITCMFLWIILAALCFGSVFDGLGAGRSLGRLFTEDLGLSPWEVLILMQVAYLVMGMFLDDTAMLVIVAPLFVPLVRALGFDVVWYGILYTITCQIAYITPPFGYNLFLMKAMAPPGVTLADIYRSVWPFVAIMALALALVMTFPQIALWLPQLYRGG
jgi:tripartite ATP-independent transporter DctM subunit